MELHLVWLVRGAQESLRQLLVHLLQEQAAAVVAFTIAAPEGQVAAAVVAVVAIHQRMELLELQIPAAVAVEQESIEQVEQAAPVL